MKKPRLSNSRLQQGGLINPFKIVKEGVSRLYHSIVGRNDAPPRIRELIKKHGSSKIVEISVCRKPIHSMIDKAINVFSLGKWAEVKRKYGYDDLFHLFMIVKLDDGKYVQLEKNGVVESKYVSSIDPHCGMHINVTKPVTFGQMVADAEKHVGKKIWLYDAKTNNCQLLVTNLLRYSGLLTPELNKYINQEVESIVGSLPEFTQKVMNTLTDARAAADVLIHGKGRRTKIMAKQKAKPKTKRL